MNIQDFQNSSLFGVELTQLQQDSIHAIMDNWTIYGDENPQHLAYIFATAYWEGSRLIELPSGHKRFERIVPVKEIGWEIRPYAQKDPQTGLFYFGRGFVQLTWRGNYLKAGKLIGKDLVNNPDIMLQVGPAAEVLVRGMMIGLFTGKKLSDFTDYVEMRRIINGTDRAQAIAGFALEFEKIITNVPKS